MKKTTTLCSLAVLLLAVSGGPRDPQEESPFDDAGSPFVANDSAKAKPASVFRVVQEQSPTVAHNNEQTKQKLDQTSTLEYTDVPIDDFLVDLSNDLQLQFVLHESAVDSGLVDDELINLSLKSTRISTALDLLLERYGCTYSVEDGIVVVVSFETADERLQTKVFHLPEIPENDPDFANLIDVIQMSVDPDSWESNGGTSRIAYYDDNLVISTTSRMERAIERLINDLNSSRQSTASDESNNR